MPKSRAAALLLAAAACGPVAACSIPDEFAGRAVDYNRSVEDAENEQILLNIVRASMRRPLHLTSLSQVRGDMTATLQLQASASAQLGQNTANPRGVSLTPTAQISNHPSFDVAVLNTKEFANGFLAPLGLGTIQLIAQGDRDARRKMFLFVEEIAVELDDGKGIELQRFRNEPLVDANGAGQFWCATDFLSLAGLDIEETAAEVPLGLELERDQVGEAVDVASAADKKVFFKREKGKVVPYLKKGDFTFAFGRDRLERAAGDPSRALRQSFNVAPTAAVSAPAGNDQKDNKKDKNNFEFNLDKNKREAIIFIKRDEELWRRVVDLSAVCGQAQLFAKGVQSVGFASEMEKFLERLHDAKSINLRFFPRSTAGVIQLAGQIVRLRQDAGSGTVPAGGAATVPRLPGEVANLMTVEELAGSWDTSEGCDGDEYWLCVAYDGRRYAVRRGDEPSAGTIATIQQLVALNKSRADAPVTSAVTIVGSGAAVR